ncbi:phage tail protein [Sphingobium sp. AP49]|uniref:phage tail protein n=1 Tax=Sphingobium sp. AP49 TaxID=1144307 RepID=UPI00026ECED2|nr:phage tail protein [Sphingobium sp. AP49]WHO39162.1 phage tail protein [Sphingobium sp. AP49]
MTLLTRHNFRVELVLSGLGGDEALVQGTTENPKGAFSEVAGLEIAIEPVTFREGGYHAGPRQLPGKTTTVPLVLKRGLSLDPGFWHWIRRCTQGGYPLPYISGSVFVRGPNPAEEDAAEFRFVNGFASKVKTADLNAGDARDVPIEELHIVHEGWWRQDA